MIVKIDKTSTSPEITFDTEKNIVFMKGRMLMENAIKFFKNVNSHMDMLKGIVRLDVDIDYMNSSSLSQLLRFLRTYDNITHVNWYYDIIDNDTKKTGDIFGKLLNGKVEVTVILKNE